jgi:hypothetical protein
MTGARSLAPFMAIDRLSVDQRTALLQGGDAARSRRRDLRLLRRVLPRVETAIAEVRPRSTPSARRPGRHQLRLLPARDPPAAARGARQEGGVMQNFPLFLSLQDRRAGRRRQRSGGAQGRAAAVGGRAGVADRRDR